MQRIDSVNARANQNGQGKNGFHDNADLSGQDATYLTPPFMNAIQEELANAIEGFSKPLDPTDNSQLLAVLKQIGQQASNVSDDLKQRVLQLESFVENSVDYFYPVGTIVDFGIQNINPNVRFVGTTWIRHGEGRVSVGLIVDNDPTAPSWTKNVNGFGGSFNQSLEVENLPPHKHSKTDKFNKFAALAQDVRSTVYDKNEEYGGLTSAENDNSKIEMEMAVSSLTAKAWEDATEQSVGQGEMFSIVQPSIVVNRWVRIA